MRSFIILSISILRMKPPYSVVDGMILMIVTNTMYWVTASAQKKKLRSTQISILSGSGIKSLTLVGEIDMKQNKKYIKKMYGERLAEV